MKRSSVVVFSLALAVAGCRARDVTPVGKAAPPSPNPEVASCDPMLRIERKVSVMPGNEWMTGSLVLAVCRGTPAESADLSPLMTWLAKEAHEMRMRTCQAGEERASPEEMATATRLLPGLKDWCFDVVSDI